jgi:hypothetical protein
MGLAGARSYTVYRNHPQYGFNSYLAVKQDAFYQEKFAGHCPISLEKPFPDLAACYTRNAPYLPLFFTKKWVGLNDNFYLGPYAIDITRPWQVLYARLFGALGFLGFFACLYAAAWGLRKGRWREPWFAALAFPIVYFGYSGIAHVEARYGFPAYPFQTVAAVVAFQQLRSGKLPRRGLLIAAAAALAAFYFWQVHAWDQTPEILF